jgi:hypothetical protein
MFLPNTTCPYCGFTECEADFVDIGVGYQQCGPYYCPECGAVEMGAYDNPKQPLDPEEQKTRWYKGGQSQTCAPNIGGVPLDHLTAKKLYEFEYHLKNYRTPYEIVLEDELL